MRKSLFALLAVAAFGLSTMAADAHHTHRVHHTVTNINDPNFNPLEFPNCLAWDWKLGRQVWICGRSAY